MRMRFLKILKITAICLLFLVIIYFFIPLKSRLDILIAYYPPMRVTLSGIICGIGIQDQLTATDWVMKGSSFEEVFDCLEHENTYVRKMAFIRINCNRKEAIPFLLDLAKNGTTEQRKRALFWIQIIGPDAIGVIADLEQMLDEDDPLIRMNVVMAVCEINRDSEAVIPVLMEMRFSENQTERSIVPYCLSKVNLSADDVIPILIDLLEDDFEPVRRNSAFTLGWYGARAEEAIPALESALEQTEDDDVRERIAEAIEKIQNPQD